MLEYKLDYKSLTKRVSPFNFHQSYIILFLINGLYVGFIIEIDISDERIQINGDERLLYNTLCYNEPNTE